VTDDLSLDRVTVMTVVMEALLADDGRPLGDPDAVDTARIVADGRCVVGGLPVSKEAFGRIGVRLRPLVDEGARVEQGDVVAELGGPVAAMRGAAPTALRFLAHLSAIASDHRPAQLGDPLEAYAARLSPGEPVGDDGPSFHLSFQPEMGD
jgi:nicotinate-nucleotide pyrophosphorylase